MTQAEIKQLNDPLDRIEQSARKVETTLAEVIKFCQSTHSRLTVEGFKKDCECLECQTKARVLRIIEDNLK